jgi:putative phosphoribosyl transferase
MSTFPPPGFRFRNRRQAGVALARHLQPYAGRRDVVVLALPRGGVPVAFEMARALGAPLDVFVVRKLGLPSYPELAMGAIASGGVRVLNENVELYRPSAEAIDAVTRAEQAELERRERTYRNGCASVPIAGHAVILVDDGLATGATMQAAVRAVRLLAPSRIVVAVPVGALATCRLLAHDVDEVVCAAAPERLSAVGVWYDDFSQTSDDEVERLLAASVMERRLRRSA